MSNFFLLFLLVMALGGAGFGYVIYEKYQRAKGLQEEILLELQQKEAVVAELQDRFRGVLSVEAEIARVKALFNQRNQALQNMSVELTAKKSQLDELSKKVNALQESSDMIEVAMYEPHFNFDDSEQYKEKIKSVRNLQKEMIKSGLAVKANTEWTVSGSKEEGQKMMKRLVQLTTRAFNNECESCIVNVSWSNIDKMEDRIEKAYSDINSFNKSYDVVITKEYMALKLDELRLNHECKLKKQQEKEEQAEIRRQMREDEKAEREAEAAAEKAEREEMAFNALLKRAREEADRAAQDLAQTHQAKSQEELDRLQQEIRALEQKVAEAEQKKERAISMAQQTKTGYVYVISNIGSFGDHVYKIGMTRRLDPQDRVNELGDASVPFSFDVHAMIRSDNAPEMESRLHRVFNDRRVNKINLKKEFFRVSLDEIEREVSAIAPDAQFIKTALADEFRRSHAQESEVNQEVFV